MDQYFEYNDSYNNLFNYFNFETPGNLIKLISFLESDDFDLNSNKLDTLSYLIDRFLKEDNPELLFYITIFIEKFYHDLFLLNSYSFNNFYHNKFKILKLINEMKTYKLDKKNIFLGIKEIIHNDAR